MKKLTTQDLNEKLTMLFKPVHIKNKFLSTSKPGAKHCIEFFFLKKNYNSNCWVSSHFDEIENDFHGGVINVFNGD